SIISSKVRVACEGHIVTQTRRTAAGGVHTVFCHATSDNKVCNCSVSEFCFQRGFEEGIGLALVDNGLSLSRLDRLVNVPAFSMQLQRMTLWTVMLNVDDRNS